MNKMDPSRGTPAQYRIGFVMEQGLGHVTHMHSLRNRVVNDSDIDPVWMPVPYHAADIWEKLPPMSIKMGMRARKMLRSAVSDQMPDCLFFHTQVLSLLNNDFVTRIPSVISLDATPLDFNTLAKSYASTTATGVLGQIKHKWYQRVFNHAAGLVAFSNWVRDSLINDYGVAEDKIRVIPSGVDLEHWICAERKPHSDKKVKLLFVGGEFYRKGGDELLQAYRSTLAEHCELDIVTRDNIIVADAGVRVHQGLDQGMPELRRLFTEADIFVLPSRGDASPFVILEAMAAGLVVISTRVGAIAEQVVHDVSGYLIADNSADTISAHVMRLVNDPNKLFEMGRAGRQRVEEKFDAQTNYSRLVDFLKETAARVRT